MTTSTNNVVTTTFDKLKDGVDKLKTDIVDLLSSAETARGKVNDAMRAICDSLTESSQTLADETARKLDNLDANTTEIPEFATPRVSASSYGVAPFIRYMPTAKNEFASISLSGQRIAELTDLINYATQSLEGYSRHLNEEQNILTPAFKAALNIYGTGTACKNILQSQPTRHTFCVANYAYSCLKAMLVLHRMPNKEFKDRHDMFMKDLTKPGSSWSADYVDFWQKITPSLSTHYLAKYFAILTPETVDGILDVLWNELNLVAMFKAALVSDTVLFQTVESNETVLKQTFAALFPKMIDMVKDFKYTVGTGASSKLQLSDDILGIRTLLAGKGSGDGDVQREEALDNFIGRGYKLEEAEYLVDSQTTADMPTYLESRINAVAAVSSGTGIHDNTPTGVYIERGGDISAKRKRVPDNDVDSVMVPANKRNVGSMVIARALPSFHKQITQDVERLDNLISPFGHILKQYGGFSLSSEFRFSTRDYSAIDDIPMANIHEYFSNIPDFYTMWVHISRIFDAAALKAFDDLLIPLFDDISKSLRISAACLNFTNMLTNGAMPVYDGTDTNSEATLMAYMEKYADELFPLNLTFRETTFISQYLSMRNKSSSGAFSNLCVTCVLDDFLLTPHVQLVLLYCMGAFIKYLELRVRSSTKRSTADIDLYRIFTNEDTLLLPGQNLLIVLLAENLVLDKLFRITHLATMRATSNLTGDSVREELKRYGRVTNIGNTREMREVLPELVSASRAYEHGLNVTIINSSQSYLQAFSQLKNVALLVTDAIDPKTYMSASANPIYNINKTIAYALYIVNKNVEKKRYDTEPDDDEDDFDTACGDMASSTPEDEYIASARGKANSLNELLVRLAKLHNPNGQFYRVKNEPYAAALDSTMQILPLSFMPIFSHAAHMPGYFANDNNVNSRFAERIFGDSNETCSVRSNAEKYLFVPSGPKAVDIGALSSELDMSPVDDGDISRSNLDDEKTLLYYLTEKVPSERAKKCVRHGSDLCMVSNQVAFSWLQQILNSLSVEPDTHIVCVIKTGANLNLPRHAKFQAMEAIGREPRTFIINTLNGKPDPDSESEWRNAIFDFNANGDTIALPIHAPVNNIGRGGAPSSSLPVIGKFPNDVMAVLNNYRRESIERQLQMDQTFFEQMTRTNAKLNSKLDQVAGIFPAAPLSEILSSLSSEIRSNNIVEMPLLDYAAAKAQLSNIMGPLGQHIEELEPLFFDAQKELADGAHKQDAERVIEMRQNFNALYRSLIKIKKLLPEIVDKHYTHAVYMTTLLNQLESCIFFAMLPLWAQIHLYNYPNLYVIDQPERVNCPYLEEFVALDDGGGLYVHLPNFLEFIDKKHAKTVLKVEYLTRFIYFIRTIADKTKPYIYTFQSCNVMRTPMIPVYIGVVCIFIAHALEKHSSLV